MADNSIAVLNIGSQVVSLGLFTATKKGLTLKDYATTNVLADPANEAVRLAQVKVAIDDLIEQVGVKKGEVYYAVSGQSVFTRFVKLPALGADNIEQLVSFEAQQHIPFPIEDVTWDWVLMDDTGAEKEVAIVAIKKGILNSLDASIESAGLKAVHVESAPVALANSFFYSYADAAEPVLIIDSGAKSTNLIYIDGKKVFIRSVNVSGVAVTSAISKEYQVDFAEAEKFKIEAGRLALNGTYLQQWDEGTANLATIISNALSRLPSEITRTTTFYKSQHGGSSPQRVYLAGAAANLPYFKEFIEEKLSLPVEYFNPFRKIGIGNEVNSEQLSAAAHTLGEVVGLAANSIGESVLAVDLVPDSVSERREEAQKRPFLIGALSAFLVGAAVWAGAQAHIASVSKQELSDIKQRVNALKPYEIQLQSLQKVRKKLDSAGGELSQVIKEKSGGISKLESLRAYFNSEYVWIASIEDLVNYTAGESSDGNLYVDDDFTSASYGTSAVKSFPVSSKKNTNGPSLNAVKIKGFWRKNEKGQNVVYEILETIRKDQNSIFVFDQDGKKLDDSQLLEIQATIDGEEISAPFTMTLLLNEPLTLEN